MRASVSLTTLAEVADEVKTTVGTASITELLGAIPLSSFTHGTQIS